MPGERGGAPLYDCKINCVKGLDFLPLTQFFYEPKEKYPWYNSFSIIAVMISPSTPASPGPIHGM